MHDAPISMDGPTQVIVAIGSLADEADRRMRGPYGGLRGRNSGVTGFGGGVGGLNMEMENTTIDFSLERDENTCPDVNNVRKFEVRPGVFHSLSSFLP